MRGYAEGQDAVLLERNLLDVTPMRFSLIVRLHDDSVKSERLIVLDQEKRDHTRGRTGQIVAAGALAMSSEQGEGRIVPGMNVMFDESVSIDDANRCFNWEGQRYVMMDLETIMGVLSEDMPLTAIRSWHLLGDRVMVKLPEKVEAVRLGKMKLHVPEAFQARRVGGKVVAVGRGIPRQSGEGYLPVDFKAGDTVLFPKFGGTDLKLGQDDYVVLRQDKILAKVEGESDGIRFEA